MTGAPRVETDALGPRAIRQRLSAGGRALTFAELIAGWEGDGAVRACFVEAIRAAPFDALFWETPPWTRGRLDATYEHVLVDAPALARLTPDPAAFAEHFAADRAVAVVPNLGGDATLVVPSPEAAPPGSAHLARFLRRATDALAGALLAATAEAMAARLGERPTWLSTSGLGVPWVHVRLDARPKYYVHGPYRDPAGG